jgi:hypothetical protein
MIPRLSPDRLRRIAPAVLALVPSDMAAEFRAIPVDVDAEGTLTVALADPSHNHAVDEIAFFSGHYVLRSVASESAIRTAIEKHYGIRFTTPRLDAPPPAGTAVRAEEPRREGNVVLLTKVKRSEDTPLPAPLPPPPDLDLPGTQAEPILLTRRKGGPKLSQPSPAAAPDPPLSALRAASDRDAVAGVVLDYLQGLTRRSIFFAIKRALLASYASRGLTGSHLRAQSIDIERPSIFRDVIVSRLPYRGPLPDTPANRPFADHIGGVATEIVLLPIAVRERIIAVVFADGALQPLPDAALHTLTREAGLAYERVILSGKGRS